MFQQKGKGKEKNKTLYFKILDGKMFECLQYGSGFSIVFNCPNSFESLDLDNNQEQIRLYLDSRNNILKIVKYRM
jgi:hypothetical protein